MRIPYQGLLLDSINFFVRHVPLSWDQWILALSKIDIA
jgi:hypothetical protein